MSFSRSRSQILGPLYDLITEASGHLRDVYMILPDEMRGEEVNRRPRLFLTLKTAHERSLTCRFYGSYRDNQVVLLRDLSVWLVTRMAELSPHLNPQSPVKTTTELEAKVVEAFKAAMQAYECAVCLVRCLNDQGIHEVGPAPEGVGRPSAT